MKNLFLIVVGAILLSFQPQKIILKNLQQVTNFNEELQMPKWAPDGRKLLLTGAHKKGLFILNLDNKSEVKSISDEIGAGICYFWGKDGLVNYVTKDSNSLPITKSILVDGNLKNATLLKSIDTLIFIDQVSLKVKAKLSDNSKEWLVTKCDGNFYNPVISPNKLRVAVNRGSDIFIFPISGSNVSANLGMGIVTSWSPDSNFILAFMDKSEDGVSISNSELFIINILDNSKTMLTNTDNVIEMWPSFSPDGKKIAFSELLSGHIFISDIEF